MANIGARKTECSPRANIRMQKMRARMACFPAATVLAAPSESRGKLAPYPWSAMPFHLTTAAKCKVSYAQDRFDRSDRPGWSAAADSAAPAA
jgi:hypothetical protein